MIIREIELREITMKRKSSFTSSRGSIHHRRVLLVYVRDNDGFEGYGECSASEEPRYCEEWTESAWSILDSLLIPRVLSIEKIEASGIRKLLSIFRGNRMAKAAIEIAIWDLEAKRANQPLWKLLGGTTSPINCGVAIGIASSISELLQKIEKELSHGYQRIKLKIEPHWDVQIVKEVRNKFPNISLMVDANGAYRIEDLKMLKQFDDFNLMMIEQPFAPDDLLAYREIMQVLRTRVCMDETLVSVESAKTASKLSLCSIANLKLGRVGGYSESILIAETCFNAGLDIWCGGQHETGLGKAHNIILASLLKRKIPAELSASSRYWEKDIIIPEISIEPDGTLLLLNNPGIGYQLDHDFINKITVRKKLFLRK